MNKEWSHRLNNIRYEVLQECAGPRCPPNNLLFLSKTKSELLLALEKGADPNADEQSTARSLIRLDGFPSHEKYECLETMFNAGLQKNSQCFQQKTLLHECTDEQSVYILLDNHVQHGPIDAFGCTAVQSLLCDNAWGSAKILLDCGVSLEHWSKGRCLPLLNIVVHIARFWALWPDDVIETLLNKIFPHLPPSNLWSDDVRLGLVSGLQSAHIHNKNWVNLFPSDLLACGTSEETVYVKYPKIFQQSPLWLASSCNDIGVVKYMLALGCNVNETDAKGQTPLHAAVASQSLQCVELLLKFGADPNIQDLKGKTPLHALQQLRADQSLLNADVHHFNIDIVLAHLLHYGADTAIVDNSDREAGTPLPSIHSPKDMMELNMQISIETYNALLNWHCRDRINNIVENNGMLYVRRL